MIYLASPYSHPDPEVREQRYRAACRHMASMIRDGHVVYSPIVQTHQLVQYGLPTDWEFWKRYDLHILRRCSELHVLMLDGWHVSIGVEAEIALAVDDMMPIQYRMRLPEDE